MTAASVIPGYVAGSWTIDPVHSEIGFAVRHLMVSKIRGRFLEYTATITTAENMFDSHVEAEIEMASIDTGNDLRDNDLRSNNFFDVPTNPKMTFRSTGIRPDGADFLLDGDLTVRGVTKSVTLKVEFGGFGPDPYGGTRAGFSATTEINRHDFGVSGNAVLEGGGVMIGDKVTISLEIEAVRSQPHSTA
jgi:polyisoprenoid-binding protein YceI